MSLVFLKHLFDKTVYKMSYVNKFNLNYWLINVCGRRILCGPQGKFSTSLSSCRCQFPYTKNTKHIMFFIKLAGNLTSCVNNTLP